MSTSEVDHNTSRKLSSSTESPDPEPSHLSSESSDRHWRLSARIGSLKLELRMLSSSDSLSASFQPKPTRVHSETSSELISKMLTTGYEPVPTSNTVETAIGNAQTSAVMQMSHESHADGWHSRASTSQQHTPVITVLTRMGSWVEIGVSLVAPLVFGCLIWYVGYRTLDECPLQPLLPVWLCVYGGCIMLNAFLNVLNKLMFALTRFIKIYKGTSHPEEIGTPSDTGFGKWVGWFEFCIVVPFLAVWTIFGGVWVFGGCSCDTCTTDCNSIAYYTVFWLVIGCGALITVAWVVIAVAIAYSICNEQVEQRKQQ